jgi:2-polyprenyl-3-methyl-5-hydroxy-6-metoxy-1,4-benzoquinol methylase
VVEVRRSAIRAAVVWDGLQRALAERAAAVGDRPLDIVDVGGGTGGLAVRLAGLGHRVTVVDPSPDALASLERRASDAGVAVGGVQGDVDALVEVIGAASVDAAICHELLEVVEKPARALERLAATVRPGGVVSVLAAQRAGAVLARAIAGHLSQARAMLSDPHGVADAGDSIERRFTRAELESLLVSAGLRIDRVRGVRVFADHLASAVVDADPGAADELQRLEADVCDRPEFIAVAAQLHVLASR